MPTLDEQQLNPQPEQPSNPKWQTLLDNSTLLESRLRQRLLQSESLRESLLLSGGKLDYSAELSLKLERLLNEASPLLGSLQTDLLGISSSLNDLRTDFAGLSSSWEKYFNLVQDQVRDLKGERDAARLQASAWRIAALVGGGMVVASLVALVGIIAWRK